MARYKWFDVKTSKSASFIRTRMEAERYSDGGSEGFLVEVATPDRVRATFVERISSHETIVDPLGRQEEVQLIEYRSHHFTIGAGRIGFEVRNGVRTQSRLISKLLEICDYDLTIIPLNVDPFLWASRFQAIANMRGRIDKLQVGSVRVAEGTVAQVAVKGPGNVQAAVDKLLGETQDFEVERVTLRLDSPKTAILFQRGASATITAEDEADLLEHVRAGLIDAGASINAG